MKKKKIIDVRFVTRVAIFSAITAILYVVPFFSFPLPFLPPFLKLHFDEIPAFIAGFAFGPLEAGLILFIKTLIKLPFTDTVGVGELADLIYSAAFIIPAAILYQRKKTFKTAIFYSLLGMLFQLIISALFNTWFMIEFYAYMKGYSLADVLYLCQKINPNIKNIKWSLAFYGIIPFNLIKDAIVLAVTFILYKRLAPIMKMIK